MRKRIIIVGAAGRDFHNFNVHFKNNSDFQVVAFTAAQIPGIERRVYPPELAGNAYPEGIPIYSEEELPRLITELRVDMVFFAYSDISNQEVMRKASLVLSHNADFCLLGLENTMLVANVPVISICAVRTGAGKSQTSRRIAKILKDKGLHVVVIRHPMPYGDLKKQVWQRFASYADLDKHHCTIEEREEYEPHLDNGIVVYAGVDYAKILEEASKEAQILIWEGGNNDVPFLKPDLHMVVADPHRAGNELTYYPSEINVRLANIVIVNKVDSAEPAKIKQVETNVRQVNPDALILEAASSIIVNKPEAIKGKRVLVVEDGPTVTHGNMPFGAATIAAKRYGAGEIVDPRPYAVGTIKKAYELYPHLQLALPALGYSDEQVADLKATIEATPCDLVLVGTPIDLGRFARLTKPTARVKYELQVLGGNSLEEILDGFLKEKVKK
jgi:predicted GTPase